MHGDRYERLARVFKALGDATRLRLVIELAQRGTVTCSEFATLCACSNSALSYHQRVLCEAGLLTVRRSGQYRLLSLRPEGFDELLPGFLERWSGMDATSVPPLVDRGSMMASVGDESAALAAASAG